MFDFVKFLATGEMTPGEQELATNLTIMYVMAILGMAMLYRLLRPPRTVDINHEPSGKQLHADSPVPSTEATLSLIRSRRSVFPKDLSGEELTRDEVDTLLEAANWAPTHARSEPWRYTVVQGGAGVSGFLDLVEEWYSQHMEEVPAQEYHHYTKKIAGCKNLWPGRVSHLIIIGMARQTLEDRRLPEWEEICACASSVQNLQLAMTSLRGVGGYWCSLTWARRFRDGAAMREFCGLGDEEDRVLGCLVLGRVQPGKTFRGHRGDIRDKVMWK